MDDLKREVYHCQRELLQEKTKVKALSEELENPMNVHRWRKLEGSDPATYEMIQDPDASEAADCEDRGGGGEGPEYQEKEAVRRIEGLQGNRDQKSPSNLVCTNRI